MNPNENAQETNSLQEKVAKFKLVARDALRMELINPRLTNLSNLEGKLKSINDRTVTTEFDIKVETYELSKLDTEHPNFEKRKIRKEETIKSLNETLEENKKVVTSVEKQIAEEKAAIAKIESGETKVSLDGLNYLVDKLILQNAKNQVCEKCTA